MSLCKLPDAVNCIFKNRRIYSIMADMEIRFFKKADIILLVFLLLLGVASIFIVRAVSGEAEVAEITVDGAVYGCYPLGTDRVIEVRSDYGYNRVVIADGRVSVDDSDCPNHDCQSFGKIGSAGQTIICIPNRMVVAILGGDGEDAVDAVVY